MINLLSLATKDYLVPKKKLLEKHIYFKWSNIKPWIWNNKIRRVKWCSKKREDVITVYVYEDWWNYNYLIIKISKNIF